MVATRAWGRARLIVLGILCGLVTPGGIAQGQVPVPSEWLTGSGNWNVPANWFPLDVPDNGGGFVYDVRIGNRPAAANALVTFIPEDGDVDRIRTLVLSNGADLDLNGNLLDVTDGATIDGAGSSLIVDPRPSPSNPAFFTSGLVARNGGAVAMNGGTLTVMGLTEIQAGSSLGGFGTVNLGSANLSSNLALDNSGAIRATNPTTSSSTFLFLLSLDADTLDLDGTSENGLVDVSNTSAVVATDTQTLVIDGPLSDAFGGVIDIGRRDTLRFNRNFALDGALVLMSGGTQTATLTGAGDATVASTSFSLSGNVVIDNDLTFTGTGNNIDVNANATLTLNGAVLIPDASTFDLADANNALVIAGATTIQELAGNFAWAGTTTTVRGTGLLTINVGTINGSGNTFAGVLNLNENADASVAVAATSWTIAGTLDKNGAGTSSMGGDTISIGGTVNVNAGTLDFNVPTIHASGSNFNVAAGAFAAMEATDLRAGANVDIDGTMLLGNGSVLAGPATLGGSGTLIVAGGSRVSANTTVNTASFDWDGTTADSTHEIDDGVTLTINSPGFGGVNDHVRLGGNGARLIVNGPASWTSLGYLRTNGSDTGVATIGGTSKMIVAPLVQSAFEVAGDTSVTAPIEFAPGSKTDVRAPAVLTLSGDAVYAGGTISGPGAFHPSSALNTVTGSATITTAQVDLDRGDWVINPGGNLFVSVTDYDFIASGDPVNRFDGASITVNGGTASLIVSDPEFVMDGALNLNGTAAAIAQWGGTPIDIGNDSATERALLNVAGAGVSRITAEVDFNADADVNIAAGATLTLPNTVRFSPSNGAANATFTGTGNLELGGAVFFSEPTTISMFGGTVDLDGADSDTTGNTVTINAPTTINANLARFGKANTSGQSIMRIDHLGQNTGSLTVYASTDPNLLGTWSLAPDAALNLVNDNTQATLLAGSILSIAGTMNVTGNVRVDAPLQVSSQGSIHILTPGQPLRIDSIRISGGTITGAGILTGGADSVIRGDGTINTPIDLDDTGHIRAEIETLTLNGALLDVGRLEAAFDGVLSIPAPWNTSVADVVVLRDHGIFQGGAITNDNPAGITGDGDILARVINNTRLQARGGVMLVQTAADDNDWDGATNAGQLHATSDGILRLRDNATFQFRGAATADGGTFTDEGGIIHTDGFALEFEPGSTLNLTSAGRYRQSAGLTTRFGGNLVANGGTIESLGGVGTPGGFLFEAGSTTTVNGNLSLVGGTTVIEAGAAFSGTGTLSNGSSDLAPINGANVNVFVRNAGKFSPGGAALGRVDLRDFQQSNEGSLAIQIRSPSLQDFDRVVVNGAAQLDGTVDLEILPGALTLDLGATFNILSATGGVTGSFHTVDIAAQGLLRYVFRPTYNPNVVTLAVTRRYYEVTSGIYPGFFTGAGTDVEKTGPDTATLTADNAYSGLTIARSGTLVAAHHNALGRGGLDIQGNAVVRLQPGLAQAVRVRSLAIATQGALSAKLDVTDNTLVVTAGDVAALSALLKSGHNAGGWNGDGILTTAATSSVGLGVARADQVGLAGQTFDGTLLAASDVLVVHTLYGDANLDRRVDFDDLARLAQNYNNTDGQRLWTEGDFSYDGNVNFDDLAKMAQNYNTALPTGAIPGAAAGFDEGWAAAMAPVPEPAGLAAMGVVLMALRRRRELYI